MTTYVDQGGYDPAGYDPLDPLTFPTPTTDPLYQPGMFWTVTGPGVVGGVTVDASDLVFVVGHGRTYGEQLYGSDVYGGPFDRDWVAAGVTFVGWKNTLDPSIRDPWPYSGCRFGDTGWHIVVDMLYNPLIGSRTYGTDLYGDDVYGDVNNVGAMLWNDVTPYGYSAVAISGNVEGGPIVDVSQLIVDALDIDGAFFDMVTPDSFYQPTVGSPIRVGMFDPTWHYYPVAVGEVERVVDIHDVPPRTLTVEAFGFEMDFVVALPRWRALNETGDKRVDRLMRQVGWKWGGLFYENAPGPALLGTGPRYDTEGRAELDRAAVSAMRTIDTDRRGNLRARNWPLFSVHTDVVVADCPDDVVGAAERPLRATAIHLYADLDAMLNHPIIGNRGDPADPDAERVVVEAVDYSSTGQHGHRTKAYGFPFLDLDFQFEGTGQAYVERILSRTAKIVNRVAMIEADTAVDERWIGVLAALDTGQTIRVHRAGPPQAPLVFDCLVVGFEHDISVGRWTSIIYLSPDQ